VSNIVAVILQVIYFLYQEFVMKSAAVRGLLTTYYTLKDIDGLTALEGNY